jgi:hypothetical protein
MPRFLRFLSSTVAAVGLVGALSPAAGAQPERLATRLPLVVIDSPARIADEPKVTARMRVMDRPGRRVNRRGDPPTAYRGRIGIETRGQLSQTWPKKSFAVETRDRRGEDRDVRLLGLPKESDWILFASYADRSLMRDALAFAATRRMGRYAPRMRYVELVLNRRYRGVYVLMEPLEIGKRRIDAGKDAVLMELTVPEKVDPGDETFVSGKGGALVSFADPDPDDLSTAEKARMRRLVQQFDAALTSADAADPARGWRRWLDERSAVDYLLLQELFRNVDAFFASTHLHATPGGRLVLGPPWDFDLALGNATEPWALTTEGWIPSFRPWASRLKDAGLRRAMLARWRELRAAGLRERLLATADRHARTLRAPARRNFARWPTLSRPPFATQPVRRSYRDEVRATKLWLAQRIAWLDGALAQAAVARGK